MCSILFNHSAVSSTTGEICNTNLSVTHGFKICSQSTSTFQINVFSHMKTHSTQAQELDEGSLDWRNYISISNVERILM